MASKCGQHPGEIHIRQEDWDKVWRDKTALLAALEKITHYVDCTAPVSDTDADAHLDRARAAIRAAKGETAS